MLLCILGFSASGKDTVANRLIDKHAFQKVVQATSRPIRVGETDGDDYHFLSKDEFELAIKNEQFISHRAFNTVDGIWYYGIERSALRQGDKKILIVDIEGYMDLKKNFKADKVLSIFINVSPEVRQKRVVNRKDANLEEFKRRAKDDEKKREIVSQNCDFTVNNDDLALCMLDIEGILKEQATGLI
jgi:guanylate kinase